MHQWINGYFKRYVNRHGRVGLGSFWVQVVANGQAAVISVITNMLNYLIVNVLRKNSRYITGTPLGVKFNNQLHR